MYRVLKVVRKIFIIFRKNWSITYINVLFRSLLYIIVFNSVLKNFVFSDLRHSQKRLCLLFFINYN